jgi:hypothetical protein
MSREKFGTESVSTSPLNGESRWPVSANAMLPAQSAKAGVEIARVEIEPNGKITVITGKPEPEQATDLDKWLGKHNAH